MSTKKTMGRDQLLRLVTCGMLIALDVVLKGLLSFKQWNIEFSFAFVAVAAAAYLYGPIAAALVHGSADFICVFLFPKVDGGWFPGFTLTAALIGVIYGLCFYRSRRVWRTTLAVLLAQLLCTLALNTLWVSVLYGKAFWVVMIGRLAQAGVIGSAQIVMIPILLAALERGVKPMMK